MSPKEFFSSIDSRGIFFFDAPSSRDVTLGGILITSQWTQFCATGCGSTIERAKDFVPEGASFHERGIETFFPPAPGMTYWIGIFSPPLNAADEISMLFPPDIVTC